MKAIKWGTNIRDLPDMVLMGAIGGGKRVYTRRGEKMKIGDVDLEVVLYGFYKDRFADVQMHFRSSSNFVKLKELLFQMNGPGRQPIRSLETYHWYGKQVSIFLAYNQILGKGAIGCTFTPIRREEQKDRKLTQGKYKEMVEYFNNVKEYGSLLAGDEVKEGEIEFERMLGV
ncbi:MAG: hypothetical protein JSW15_03745 [Deltaproteobacteria bacterium]|jgi:hypothetical protein|nr:MAG: hypothetical protein JSW15_03745 [Deltaproteobacteria bacterium]